MIALDDAVSQLAGDLDYPMLIVTVACEGERSGCLVGFASQCSIDPPRFMVWLSKRNHTFRVAEHAGALAVHFPAADQRDLAALFGSETSDDVDKFEHCNWHPGPEGLPILDDCARWLAGRVLSRHDTGDHVGFLLEPRAVETRPWPGQLRFQAVRDLDPGHDA